MHPAIRAIRSSLGYVTFKSPDIKDATFKLLNSVGTDLESVDYEQPTHVDEAIAELENAISEYDGKKEAIDDVIETSEVTDADADES